jgi:flagellar biosynthesis anti-sigma factor FlgM
MIINNNQTPDISPSNLGNTQSPSRATGTGAYRSAPTDGTPGDDSISLSNSPNLLQQALASSSSARSARVLELQALVRNGQYQPAAQEVSRAMIEAHLTGD